MTERAAPVWGHTQKLVEEAFAVAIRTLFHIREITLYYVCSDLLGLLTMPLVISYRNKATEYFLLSCSSRIPTDNFVHHNGRNRMIMRAITLSLLRYIQEPRLLIASGFSIGHYNLIIRFIFLYASLLSGDDVEVNEMFCAMKESILVEPVLSHWTRRLRSGSIWEGTSQSIALCIMGHFLRTKSDEEVQKWYELICGNTSICPDFHLKGEAQERMQRVFHRNPEWTHRMRSALYTEWIVEDYDLVY